jgi:hypothetical protein
MKFKIMAVRDEDVILNFLHLNSLISSSVEAERAKGSDNF